MRFVKKDFTFGFRTVKSGEILLIQTTNVPMLIYKFPSSSLRCRANPNLLRRSFEPFELMLYHRMVLEPHTAYPIPAGTRYILLMVQNTVFGLDIFPEIILFQLMENGFNLGDFRKIKRFDQKAYNLPLPTPAHILLPDPPRPPAPIPPQPPKLKTPQILLPDPPQPPVQIPDPPVQTPQTPVQITDPPMQTPQPPVQILLPLVVETLGPTLTADSSMDQIMASVFGDYSQKRIPPAHTQEPQVLDTVPCDESVRNLSTNLLRRLFGENKFAFISNQIQKDVRDI
ncbi:uncharacterized protein TNCV_4898581 [Trichonephila clavipes]|nr:uncharacterized protein TNCV_4898581 [Trichonephila clavipes]